eukprot:TRINITY_DN33846_c0_g1_i1.p1 TRINITY_DN33846_c0_g1~~TRINITY_DN33846_c0_g1_i1.p1  ORF type:complete len:170 (+),score=25.51 TRINITY_DN33846_c0_g1_i1:3-512(+)
MVHPRFKPGDHLWKKGGRLGGKLYDHHLIYKGDGSCGFHVVIENSFRAGGVVQKTLPDEKLSSFVLYERPADAEVCLARAEAALGESYSLLFFNCETFANQRSCYNIICGLGDHADSSCISSCRWFLGPAWLQKHSTENSGDYTPTWNRSSCWCRLFLLSVGLLRCFWQ